MIKRTIKRAINSLGFELTRRRPAPPTPEDIQIRMMDAAPDLIVFDVGAHSGATSRTYRQRLPEAVIHAFEPTPAAVEQLRAMFADDDRHHVHALALDDRQGELEFHLNASGATNSLLGSEAEAPMDWRPLVETREKVKVATQTIDAFCAEHGIPRIDILKMDVQGAESRVLAGAREMLARGAIKCVFLEVIVAPTYVGQSSPDRIFSLLCGAGLSLVGIYGIWKRGEVLLQFDALFALPEYAKRLAEPA